MKHSKILPLHGLDVQAKPFNKRALAWSCDAELAAATDDAVTVFLPEFPMILPASSSSSSSEDEGAITQANGHDSKKSDFDIIMGDGGSSTSDSDGDPATPGRKDPEPEPEQPLAPPETFDARQQFFDGMRVFPVTHPPLSAELNRHLWEAAGKEFPLVDTEDLPEQEINPHPGAGSGVIASVGSTLNHVVAIDWSPSGVGRNRRPVLAVLTACGSLAVYGEGGPTFGMSSSSLRVGHKGRAARDLGSWVVLWAVGENFIIPGQEAFGYGERIKAFAWCQEVAPGKALLAYMNDQREIVIVGVGTEFKMVDDGMFEEAVWNVTEVCRFEVTGAHIPIDVNDPEFVPGDSSFSLRWSPWIQSDDCWTCFVSYMDRDYVGFRRITLEARQWQPMQQPAVVYDEEDWDGRCIHLGPDAFLEFENLIWDTDGDKICRGIIATPLVAEPFAVNLSARGGAEGTHSTEDCNTTFPSHVVTNPIMGLIVHPISSDMTENPPPVPLYTAVRLSATHTNTGWYESNIADQTSEPQWAVEIHQKISIETPFSIVDLDAEDSSDSDTDSEDSEEESDQGRERSGPDEDDDDSDESDSGITSGPTVHPYRIRIWGLAASPGGGSSCVLAITQTTQRPERGWENPKSKVIFGFKKYRDDAKKPRDPDAHSADETPTAPLPVGSMTTEGRLWEWMYGGGPGVPGITHAEPLSKEDVRVQASRDWVKGLFAARAAVQTCAICDDGTRLLVGPIDSVCRIGHRLATCGASGLAIQEPGISRACGVCRSRCLKVNKLVEVLPPDEADFVRAVVTDEICGKCGGKYLD